MNLNATLIVQAIVFIILGWVTMKFIWPPLIKALDERRQKIADGLAAAEQGSKSLGEATRKIAQLESDAKARAQLIIIDTEKRAQAIVDAAKAQAKAEGDRLIEAAKVEAEQQLVRVKLALRDQVADLVVAGAEQILKREVDARTHTDLLNQLKAQL
ncbi:F0 sector of membrane-bound ATP synthase, subunit b [Burkholderiales bacterium]|nr:F0 sector of membrane-bound ATP synthase, subunit b [Burkholderiales bacterium]